ncbi:hypothetical protein TrRE_jg8564 [Triparma retinervis]|uniref:Uncharacterized protein n=1 Tax=Triparma retinervis TaxID=2557542 RepID=A0A9W6Z807_9STRA|nr:hypothetical protein TrRE_jg8564 [Triparma retinervis]
MLSRMYMKPSSRPRPVQGAAIPAIEYCRKTVNDWGNPAYRKKNPAFADKRGNPREYDFAKLENFLSSLPNLPPPSVEENTAALTSRKEDFVESKGWSEHEWIINSQLLSSAIGKTANSTNAQAAKDLYVALRVMGYHMNIQNLNAFLSTFGRAEGYHREMKEVARYYGTQYPMKEPIVALMINNLCNSEDGIEEAMEILGKLETSEGRGAMRLRTYSPILEAMMKRDISEDNSRAVFEYFDRMVSTVEIKVTDEEYMSVLGYAFRAGGKGLDVPQGEYIEELVTKMAESSLSVTEESANQLVKESGGRARIGEVDRETGICELTGATLRQLTNSPRRKALLVDAIKDISGVNYQAFLKLNNGKDEKQAKMREKRGFNSTFGSEQISIFEEWMSGRNFSVIIDGANVAYYSQNHAKGRFSYNQIAMVVAALERAGEHCLVVLPSKYTNKMWTVSSSSLGVDGWSAGANKRFRQRLTEEEAAFIETWHDREQLYVAPALCLDDYYWMLASVAGGGGGGGGGEDSLFKGCYERLIVSNDLLRDHNLEVAGKIGELAFHRWVVTQFVGYEGLCLGWEREDEGKEVLAEMSKRKEDVDWEVVERGFAEAGEALRFITPDKFSIAIQRNEVGGGEDGGRKGAVWHFPIRVMNEGGEIEIDKKYCVVNVE